MSPNAGDDTLLSRLRDLDPAGNGGRVVLAPVWLSTLDRGHAITRAPRRQPFLVAALGAVATILVVVALVLVIRSPGPDHNRVTSAGSGIGTESSQPSSTESAPSPKATRASSPYGSQEPAPSDMTVHPAPPAAPEPTTPNYSSAKGCGLGERHGNVVSVTLLPDGPVVACVQMQRDDQLRVVNEQTAVLHGKARDARLRLSGFPVVTLKPRHAVLYAVPIGKFLAVGQHELFYGPPSGLNIDIDVVS